MTMVMPVKGSAPGSGIDGFKTSHPVDLQNPHSEWTSACKKQAWCHPHCPEVSLNRVAKIR